MDEQQREVDLTHFSRVIREAMARQEVKNSDLAEAVGVSRGAVGNWKAGTARPHPHRLPAIEDALSLTPGALVRALAGVDTEDDRGEVADLRRRVERLEEHMDSVLRRILSGHDGPE